MLFNSLEFLVFLPLVFAGFWLCASSVRLRNLLVVAASAVFYGWFDLRFLALMAILVLWTYAFGLLRPSRGKFWIAVAGILGALGYFKYCNFFLAQVGFDPLQIVLPVGISFYAFMAVGYLVDVAAGRLAPERDPVTFFAFLSFFPQIAAGPIGRGADMLPQFRRPFGFDAALATDGCRQMLWGFFKKTVVADNLATVVGILLNGKLQANGAAVALGAVLFTVQIYADFSGYSDIAIGCGKLFGFRLRRNFACPYFACDIAEFWRRWHMSLTTWFRDYVYIPLGGSRGTKAQLVRNTFVVFLLSGLWHGANWTFVLWGALHAAFFLPLLLGGRNRTHRGEFGFSPLMLLGVTLGWLLFTAPSVSVFGSWLQALASLSSWNSLGKLPHEFGVGLGAAVALFAVEALNRTCEHGLAAVPRFAGVRWAVYLLLVGAMVFGAPASHDFVYFKF